MSRTICNPSQRVGFKLATSKGTYWMDLALRSVAVAPCLCRSYLLALSNPTFELCLDVRGSCSVNTLVCALVFMTRY